MYCSCCGEAKPRSVCLKVDADSFFLRCSKPVILRTFRFLVALTLLATGKKGATALLCALPKGSVEAVLETADRCAETLAATLDAVAAALGVAPRSIALPFSPARGLGLPLIAAIAARYGVRLVEDRAVILFDAVGFSLLTPLQQVVQLAQQQAV